MVFLIEDKKDGTREVYSTNRKDDDVNFDCDGDLVTIRKGELEIKFDMVEAYRIWVAEIRRKKNEHTVVY